MTKSLKWLFSVLIYDTTDKCFGAAVPTLLSWLLLILTFSTTGFGNICMFIGLLSFLVLLLPVLQLFRWKQIHLAHKVIGILYLVLDLLVYAELIAFLFFRD